MVMGLPLEVDRSIHLNISITQLIPIPMQIKLNESKQPLIKKGKRFSPKHDNSEQILYNQSPTIEQMILFQTTKYLTINDFSKCINNAKQTNPSHKHIGNVFQK